MSSTSGEDAGSRQKWGLDRQSLEALLAMLGGRTDTGAEQYERIRTKLIRFFTWERCPFPEEHTDEVLNRVARRVGEGEEILNPDSYFYGVARMVVKEVQQRSVREERSMEELRRRTAAEPPAETEEEAASCLQECLEALEPEPRSLILAYYHGERSARIGNRKRMADEYGIPLNALRNRALRLRDRLQACLRGCLRRKRRDNPA